MSDYIPNPRRPENENKYGTYDETAQPSGRSSFALVALLAIVALIGGVLYFGKPTAEQQAQMPDKTMTTPNTNAPGATPGTLAVPPKPPAATPTRPQE